MKTQKMMAVAIIIVIAGVIGGPELAIVGGCICFVATCIVVAGKDKTVYPRHYHYH